MTLGDSPRPVRPATEAAGVVLPTSGITLLARHLYTIRPFPATAI